MVKQNAVWLVTGCSKGLGRAIAQQALANGYRVVVTARNAADVADIVEQHQQHALAVQLDVSKPDQIKAAVVAAEERFGGVDVLVNNAGVGYFSAIEEGEDAGVRAMYETNVWGPLNLIKAVLPGMRERKQGHIINLSSVGGIVCFPVVGYYHMAKFAIEALSDTLAKEVSPFGIGVTVVEPGAFLTDFRGATSENNPTTRLSAHAETLGKARDTLFAAHRAQRGDPQKGAQAILTAVESDKPPVHFVIGGDALDQIRQKLTSLQAELQDWEEVTRSTDLMGTPST